MADNTPQAAAAAETGGATTDEKVTGAARIRMPYPNDKFVVDGKTTVTSVFQDFAAAPAKKIQEVAKANGVKLIVEPTK